MKALLYFGLCLISSLGFCCQVVFVSQSDQSQVLLAGAIAKNLFFKSSCARVIDASSTPMSPQSNHLMDEWNLSPMTIEKLDVKDLEKASLILTMTEEEKTNLQTSYPEFQQKIEVISHCAGSKDKSLGDNLETFRQDVFQFEDIISSQKWQCLKNQE